MEDLVSVMKRMQRINPQFKEAWASHCMTQLGGFRDPGRHDPAVLQEFLDWWQSENGHLEDEKPSPKLVERIKRLQRSSAQAKQAWIEYTDTELGGKRDPNLHTASALEAFLANWEENPGEATPVFKANVMSNEEPPPSDLVDKVKRVQRMSPQGKQAWIDYCDGELGGVRDPNRHQADALAEFLDQWDASAAAMWDPGEGGKVKAGPQPVEFVKQGSRLSPAFKAAWGQYCQQLMGGTSDPGRYDEAFLSSFAEYAGRLVSADLAEGGSGELPSPPVPPPSKKRPVLVPPPEQPGAKRVLTVKRSVADLIRRLNAEIPFSTPIRLGAVAAPLCRLEEAAALQVLDELQVAALEGVVEDPNVFVRSRANEFA